LTRRGPFDLVIASEVLEHLRAPRNELAIVHRLAAPRSLMYIRTGRYRPGCTPPDWAYFMPHIGLHVSFFSAHSIRALAAFVGFTTVHQAGGENEWLLSKPSSTVASIRIALLCGTLTSEVQIAMRLHGRNPWTT
jgi:hypothetical protein